MRKNLAGQRFFFQASQVDNSPVTTGVTGTVAKDNGADAAITGTLTHLANGKWRCDPSQADTNGDYLGFTFSGGSMVTVTRDYDTTWHEAIAGTKTTTDKFTFTGGFVDSHLQAVESAAIKSNSFDTDAISATAFSQGAADKAWSTTARTITGGTITTNSDKTGYALSAAGVDAIWDELQSGHTTVGTFGYYLDARVSDAGGGGGTDWTASEREQIRQALGVTGTKSATASGNLDTVLSRTDVATSTRQPSGAVDLNADQSGVTIGTVNALSAAAISAIWAETVDGTFTAAQSMQLANAANAGKTSGSPTTNFQIRDPGDTVTRINATVDANGNRTTVTYSVT